jgi:hypothetical protein
MVKHPELNPLTLSCWLHRSEASYIDWWLMPASVRRTSTKRQLSQRRISIDRGPGEHTNNVSRAGSWRVLSMGRGISPRRRNLSLPLSLLHRNRRTLAKAALGHEHVCRRLRRNGESASVTGRDRCSAEVFRAVPEADVAAPWACAYAYPATAQGGRHCRRLSLVQLS